MNGELGHGEVGECGQAGAMGQCKFIDRQVAALHTSIF